MTRLFFICQCPHGRAGCGDPGCPRSRPAATGPPIPAVLCPSRSSGTRRARTPLRPGNYNSQQAAGRRGAGAARQRTVVSSMATVLSRALKLPGKGCAPAGRTERRPGRGSRARGSPERGRHECRCLRAAGCVAIVMCSVGGGPEVRAGGARGLGGSGGAVRGLGGPGRGPVRGLRGTKGGADL